MKITLIQGQVLEALKKIPNFIGIAPDDFWEITTQQFKDAHFAVFPEALVEKCIKVGCPENGTVLDPFVGSGTTLAVAIRLRRNAIGIDIKDTYIQMAMKRCNLKNNPFITTELITFDKNMNNFIKHNV